MDKYHDEKIDLMSQFLGKIAEYKFTYIGKDVPKEKIIQCTNYFALGLDIDSVIGYYDTAWKQDGKRGMIFTDDRFYYKDIFEGPICVFYDDIMETRIINIKPNDCDCTLEIIRKINYDRENNSNIKIECTLYNKTPLKKFLDYMKDFDVRKNDSNTEKTNPKVSVQNSKPVVKVVNNVVQVGKKQAIQKDCIDNEVKIIMNDIPTDIGTASIKGNSKDKIQITIQNENGHKYEFYSIGNEIGAFVMNGKMYTYTHTEA